jgi:hypothetical protein
VTSVLITPKSPRGDFKKDGIKPPLGVPIAIGMGVKNKGSKKIFI